MASQVDITVPHAPTATLTSVRNNFIRARNEIQLLQVDITARQSAQGQTGANGSAGQAGQAGVQGAGGATGATGQTGATGVKGPPGGGATGGLGGSVVTALTSPFPTEPSSAGLQPGTLLIMYSGTPPNVTLRVRVRGHGGGWLTVGAE